MAVKAFGLISLGKAGLVNPEQVGYEDSIEIIRDETLRVQKSFVKIGWYLKHIRDDELYKEDGYTSFYECAAEQLGFSQSTISRFINICEKFSKNHNSPELDDKYTEFDKSQMIEMLPLAPEQLEKVTPDMTVKEIRRIKRKENNETSSEKEDNDDIPGQTSIQVDFPEYMPRNQQEEDITTPTDSLNAGLLDGEDEVVNESFVEQTEEENTIESNSTLLMADDDISEESVCENCCEETAAVHFSENQPPIQGDLMPVLKNNDQRKEWLNNYKAWGLWYYDEHIDVNYYKYDFTDGSRLVVAEYPNRFSYWSNKRDDEYYYHLLEKNKKGYKKVYDEEYRHAPDSETYLTEFLKRVQKNNN